MAAFVLIGAILLAEASANERQVYFATASAGLDDRARLVIDRLAEELRVTPEARLIVEGHADARGSRRYNRQLSLRRAEAVRDRLARSGIAIGRIDLVGHGEDRPALYDSGEPVWMFNRRVTIRSAD